jgi:hypothetical protein
VLVLAVDTPSVKRISDSCESVGFNPLFGFPSHETDDSHLKISHMDGHVVAYLTAPHFLTAAPGIAAMVETIKQYAPGAKINGAATLGWTSALLLGRAMRNLAAPTAQGVLDGLWSIDNEDLDGITPPLTFKRGAPNNGVTTKLCYWVVRAVKGSWSTDGERYCSPWDTKMVQNPH